MSAVKYPEAFEELIELLKTLPGIGRRSAERMALAMYSWDPCKLNALGENLRTLRAKITKCPLCGNMSENGADGPLLCPVCASPSRDRSTLCIVEEFTRIRNIEDSGVFRGLYHVLGGRLAPLEGKGIESLDLEGLEKRLAGGETKEVILALSPDVEGQATAVFLARRLKAPGLKLSSLARGLPAGSDLSYADPATVAAAVSGRIMFDKGEEEK